MGACHPNCTVGFHPTDRSAQECLNLNNIFYYHLQQRKPLLGPIKRAFTGAGPHLTHSYALNPPVTVTVTDPTGHPDPAKPYRTTQQKQIFEKKHKSSA